MKKKTFKNSKAFVRYIERITGKPFKPAAPTEGTTAYEYLNGLRPYTSLFTDPDLIAVVDDKQLDGSLLYVFSDQSSVVHIPASVNWRSAELQAAQLSGSTQETADAGAGFRVLGAVAAFLGSSFAIFQRNRSKRAKEAEAKRRVKELREKLVEELHQKWTQFSIDENLLGQLLSTSTAQAPVGIAEGPASIAQLRQQVSAIEQKIQNQRSEIVEISKIDPALEATIKASIDNLTKRIEFLEKTRLEKWDVALVVFQVVSAMGVLFGLFKYFLTKAP